jgi:hypothetical protein
VRFGGALRIFGEGVPFLDERGVGGRLDRFEVVPRRKMADQRLGIDAGQFFLADRERDDGDIRGLDALVALLFVERHVGVAIDGGDDGGFLAG